MIRQSVSVMAVMTDLHIHYAWMTTLAGIGFIVTGFALCDSSTVRIPEGPQRSGKNLRAELDARLREQTALSGGTANLANDRRLCDGSPHPPHLRA